MLFFRVLLTFVFWCAPTYFPLHATVFLRVYQHFAFFFFVSRRSRSRQTFSQFCSFFLVFGLVQLSRHKMTTAVSKKRAKDIKKKYTKDDDRFAPFFSTNICYFGLKID